MAIFYEKGEYSMQDSFAVRDLRYIVNLYDSPNEREYIFIVSQTYSGGRWNKLCKSQERWWYKSKVADEIKYRKDDDLGIITEYKMVLVPRKDLPQQNYY